MPGNFLDATLETDKHIFVLIWDPMIPVIGNLLLKLNRPVLQGRSMCSMSGVSVALSLRISGKGTPKGVRQRVSACHIPLYDLMRQPWWLRKEVYWLGNLRHISVEIHLSQLLFSVEISNEKYVMLRWVCRRRRTLLLSDGRLVFFVHLYS
jgi:hypothetical protein